LSRDPFFIGIINDQTPIASVISPYDFVLKGTMENYIIHILDSVYNFNPTGFFQWNIAVDAKHIYARTLKPFMFTSQGFSSPLKGIFDIFYTLFIIENFANRSLVTQKINKELKRIAICAQVLYIHFNELLTIDGSLTVIIQTLQNMILIGYNGSNLLSNDFANIMTTYVTFVSQLIVLLSVNVELLFYCAPNIQTRRGLTSIENYFMNFLVYSSPNPPTFPPPPPPDTADAAYTAANIPNKFTDETLQNPLFRSLSCIPGVFTALNTMPEIVHSLYKNKLYAACRDSINKSEGVIAIASAYQSFLWSKLNSEKIKGLDGTDTHCVNKLDGALGIKQLLERDRTVLDSLVTSLNPCWSNFPAQAYDLLDLNSVLVFNPNPIKLDDVEFLYVLDNNVGKFLIFSWFITSVFGIKTKSKPSKILALGRTYLKLFVESYNREALPKNNEYSLFNCNFKIQPQAIAPENAPQVPDERSTSSKAKGDVHFICTDYRILCLAYSSFNIENAIQKYREIQNGYDLAAATGDKVIRKIIRDEQGNRNSAQILGIMYGSDVFQNEILKQLLIRFSILPRGKEFTITASVNMRFLIMKLYQFITLIPVIILTIESFSMLCKNFVEHIFKDVQELNIYTPSKHDTSKFENFPRINEICSYQYFRTKWIIYLVRGMINSLSDNLSDSDYKYVYTFMKLFILLIKYLINVDEIHNLHVYIFQILTADIASSSGIGADTTRFLKTPPVQLSHELLINVDILIQSEYPETRTECKTVLDESTTKNKTPSDKSNDKGKPVKSEVAKPDVTTKPDKQRNKPVARTAAGTAAGILAGFTDPTTADNPGKEQAPTKTKAKPKGTSGSAKAGGTISFRPPCSPKKSNNHTRKNKYKRKNKDKKHKSSPKYRKVNPSSRSGSQSNRKKSKSKLQHKNVTFKRRRARK